MFALMLKRMRDRFLSMYCQSGPQKKIKECFSSVEDISAVVFLPEFPGNHLALLKLFVKSHQ